MTEFTFVQIITIAPVNRSRVPRRCNIHKFHVWRFMTDSDDPNQRPPKGAKCQCGCLEEV